MSIPISVTDKLKFADVLVAQTSTLIRLIRAGLDVRKSNLDDRLLLDRIEDTITAYREADGGSIDLTGDPWSLRREAMSAPIKSLGYGRYGDDPKHVGCPRARTDMTPCVARDGYTAQADDGVCVGCGKNPADLLTELVREVTKP